MKLHEIANLAGNTDFWDIEHPTVEQFAEYLDLQSNDWKWNNGKLDINTNLYVGQITDEISGKFPYPLGVIKGDFEVDKGSVDSFDGPTEVHGRMEIHKFTGTDLSGGPGIVSGDYSLGYSEFLKSMKGIPSTIGGYLVLTGAKSLKSWEHAPSIVKGDFEMAQAAFASLIGIHEQIKEVHGSFTIDWTEVKEGGLGLIMIKGITELQHGFNGNNPFMSVTKLPEQFMIINKYLGKPDAIFECQQELIEEGFEAFAQL